MTTHQLVRPITCWKCKGSGDFTRASGMIDYCAPCSGTGIVEGDKATIKATKERIARFRKAWDTCLEWDRGHWTRGARYGLERLEEHEPHRLEAAIAAVLAGHPTVMQHLSDYAPPTSD